jgi:hypothetical protein
MNICLHIFFVFCGSREWPCYRQLPHPTRTIGSLWIRFQNPKKIGDNWPHWYVMPCRKQEASLDFCAYITARWHISWRHERITFRLEE